jgi:hypothetical protein
MKAHPPFRTRFHQFSRSPALSGKIKESEGESLGRDGKRIQSCVAVINQHSKVILSCRAQCILFSLQISTTTAANLGEEVNIYLTDLYPELPFRVWHSSVVVFGREYEYDDEGLLQNTPGHSPYKANWIHLVGRTHLTQQQLESHIASISSAYTKEKYHVVDNNCNKFTKEICRFLVKDPDFPSELQVQEELSRGIFGKIAEVVHLGRRLRKFLSL